MVLPGAWHKFDLDNTRHVNLPANTKTKEGCPLEFDVLDIRTRDRRTGEVLSAGQIKDINRELCADKGASVQGDPKARAAAAQAQTPIRPDWHDHQRGVRETAKLIGP